MYPHHRETLDRIKHRFAGEKDVLGVVLVGSIAHGFARPKSDVDILVVIPDHLFDARAANGTLTTVETDCCTYAGGYVDIKFVSLELMERVRSIGSEPARFAYEGASLILSHDERIAPLVSQIARYPIENKSENLTRFFAQLKAWDWYADEAVKHGNAYLLNHAINNLILFGGRLVLAHNEMLYPYHKWFMRVLAEAAEQPEGLMPKLNDLVMSRDAAKAKELFELVASFQDWPEADWPSRFVRDSELNWMTGHTPVADI